MKMMFCHLLLLACSLVSQPLLAAISVSVDREPVAMDESFKIIFKSDEEINAQPDFSALQQSFTIISTNSSTSTQIVNSHVSYSQKWILTVFAKHSGTLEIPPIRFGKYSSQSKNIEVTDSSITGKQAMDRDLFIEVNVDNAEPYVQAQVIFTIKLFRATTIRARASNQKLSEPSLSGGNAIINKLGDDKAYQLRRQGKRYDVIERRYVIFPQNSGRIIIEPMVFQGTILAARTPSSTLDPFSMFMFDPFQNAKTIAAHSKQVALDVKPIPSEYTGKTWLPAKHLAIEEQWSVAPDKIKQGEAVTRVLTIKADGLASSNLPGIVENLPASLKHYPSQPELEEVGGQDDVVGLRHEKMAVIATKGGEIVLPAISIPWWNTVTDKAEIAEFPERTLTVKAVASAKQDESKTETPATGSLKKGITEVDNDTNHESVTDLWPWLSAALLCLWLLTLYVWRRSTHRNQRRTQRQHRNSIRQLQKKVVLAARSNDAAATKRTLLDWANRQWPQQHFINIGQLKCLLNSDMQREIDILNASLYGNNDSTWAGNDFAASFQAQVFKDEVQDTPGTLEPLYRM